MDCRPGGGGPPLHPRTLRLLFALSPWDRPMAYGGAALVEARRGRHGGYRLRRAAAAIPLLEVLRAVESDPSQASAVAPSPEQAGEHIDGPKAQNERLHGGVGRLARCESVAQGMRQGNAEG